MKARSDRALATSLLTLFVTYSASAADQIWLPAGPSDWWNLTDLNWDAGAIWTQNNNAIFGGTADTITVTDAIIFNDMTFNSTGYTISSAGAGNLTLGTDGASTITVTNVGDTAAINETIAGGSLTKAGNGTLVLGNSNTYTGATIVNGGTLQIGTGGATGQLGTGSVSLAAGTTLTYDRSGAVSQGALNSAATGNGTLNVNGGAALTLNASGNFSGVINVNSGSLIAGATNPWQSGTNSPTFNLAAGTTLTNTTASVHAHIGNITMNGATWTTGAGTGSYDTENYQLNGTVTIAGTAASTITREAGRTNANSGVALNGNRIFNVGDVTGSTAADLTVSTELENSDTTPTDDGLTKTGAGTMVLASANSYSGATTVTVGTLRATASLSLGGTSGVTVNTGAKLETAGTNIFVADHGTAVASTKVITLNNAMWEMTTAHDARIGNVTLNNGSTWTSNRVLTGYDALLANTSTGAATVAVTGTGASVMNGSGGLHLQGVQNFDVADTTSSAATDLTVSMILDNAGSTGGALGGLNKLGAGTMELTATNTYTGATTVAAGTLRIGGAGRLNAGAYSGGIGLTAATSVFDYSSSAAQALSGVISGSGALLKNGAGTLTFNGTSNNTYAGGTTISNGTLSLGTGGTGANTSTVTALGSGIVNINSGGTLRLWIQNSSTFTIANNFSINGGTLRAEDGVYNMSGTVAVGASGATFTAVYGGKDLNLNNAISGSGLVTVNGGGGTVRFVGNNTYNGSTTLNNGTLVLNNANASSGFNLVGGTLALRSISLSSTQNITGAGNVTKDGAFYADSTIAGNNNTYTGSTIVNVSDFKLAAGGVINGTSKIDVLGQFLSTFTNQGSITTAGAVTLFGGSNNGGGVDGLFTNGNAAGTLAGVLNSGSVTLSSSNLTTAGSAHGGQFVNNTGSTVNTGAITVNGSGSSFAGGSVNSSGSTFSNGGTVSAASLTLNSSSTANTVANKGGTYTQTAGSTTLTGALTLAANGGSGATGAAGNDAVFNLNGGTVSAASVAVNGGTLALGTGGTLTSQVTVNNRGTLAGGGTINGNMTVTSGGTHAIGTSPGLQTVNGTATYESGSIFAWDLASSTSSDTGTRGTDYDGLDATNINAQSGSIFRVILASTPLADIQSGVSEFWTTTQFWDDIFVGSFAGNFSAIEVFNTGNTNITSTISTYGNFSSSGGTLTWSAVPEPTSAVAGLLLGAGLLRRRRR